MKTELKLGTFKFPDRPGTRTGSVVGEHQVVDLNLAYATYLVANQLAVQPYQLANAVVPTEMVSFLKGGQEALEAARKTVAYIQGNAGVNGPNGERLVYNLTEVTVLNPVWPTKIICIGRSFMSHVQIGHLDVPDEPHIFFKPHSSIVEPEGYVLLPKVWPDKVTYGTELTAVIGKKGKNFTKEEAYNYVAGWTILNDVTCRGMLYPKNKTFDTFAPFGPYIVPFDQIPEPQKVELKFRVNGEWKQEGNTKDMMWTIPEIIANVSQHMTLEVGDIIALGDIGAPDTVKEGDIMEAIIPQIGVLRNPVKKEE